MLQSAYGLLENGVVAGKTLMVIYTDGRELDLGGSDRNGSTGYWRMGARRHPDQIAIYHRTALGAGGNIYLADFVRKVQREDGRFCIYLADVRHLGATTATWSEFANKGDVLQSPIRYLTR